MDSVWQIVKRWWALMSCAAWTFLALGVLRFNPTAGIQIRLYWALAGVFIVIAVLQTILAQRQRIHELEHIPPQLTVVVEDIVRHRSTGPLDRWQYADIFILVSTHLHAPQTAEIKYTLDLVRRGSVTCAEQLNDIHVWHLADRKDFLDEQIGFHKDVNPLSTSLSAMNKSEGWLHFQVRMSDMEVSNSRMRLYSTSPYGMVCVERDMIGTVIRPLMFHRKVASGA